MAFKVSILRPYISISRPWNVVIAFLTVIVAAALGGTSLEPFTDVVLAAISASLITIGANVINDIFDEQIDRINKPQRPLPAGELSRRAAMIYFSFVYLSALTVAAFLTPEMLFLALIVALLLILYSWRLKRMVLWGNILVSAVTALAFIYGAMAVDKPSTAVFPALFAFLFHFGREILKDMQDIAGDSAQGARTYAVIYGREMAYYLIVSVFIVLIVVTIIPYILNIYGIVYMAIVALGIYPLITYVMIRCRRDKMPATLGLLSNLLKADMVVGLIAIYFG